MTTRVPIILAVIGALLVVSVVLGAVRLLLLTRPHRGGFDCALWRRPRRGGTSGRLPVPPEVAGRWRHGLMCFGPDCLRWYGVVGIAPGPQLSLRRAELVDVIRHALPAPAGESGVAYTLVEFVRSERGPIRVIVPTPSASAIITWLEAAPTGSLGRGTY